MFFVFGIQAFPRYIAVKKELNCSQAQDYCYRNFWNGILCSFENETDLREILDLIRTVKYKNDTNQFWWTALTFDNHTYKFSDGANATFANKKVAEYAKYVDKNVSGKAAECVALDSSENLNDHWFSGPCNDTKYFICKANITKGITSIV